MSTTRLVLLRSRQQRLCESLFLAIFFLTIGELLRAVLGDSYNGIFGFLSMIAVWLLTAKLGAVMAPRFGGKWVSKEELVASVLVAQRAIPLWRGFVRPAVKWCVVNTGLLLLLAPLRQLIGTAVGREELIGCIIISVVVGVLQVLQLRRILAGARVAAGDPPAGEARAQMLRILPSYYGAWAVGTGVGMLVGWQFGDQRTLVFSAAAMVIPRMIMLMLPSDRRVRTLYTGPAGTSFVRLLWLGLLFWGVPGVIFVSGIRVVDMHEIPTTAREAMTILEIALPMSLGGALYGALWYLWIQSNSKRRRGFA
jgi:hypothetical protein